MYLNLDPYRIRWWQPYTFLTLTLTLTLIDHDPTCIGMPAHAAKYTSAITRLCSSGRRSHVNWVLLPKPH